MTRSRTVLVAAGVAAAATAGVALASGGPPPVVPADPPAFTVVATGTAGAAVHAPARRTDATIERAVRAARVRAVAPALAAARTEAQAVGAAARLRAGQVVAVRRDVAPLGYWAQDEGRFGPGVWCGRIYTGRRTVRRPDGTTRRVNRYRHGCQVPGEVTIRLTATFAAEPLG